MDMLNQPLPSDRILMLIIEKCPIHSPHFNNFLSYYFESKFKQVTLGKGLRREARLCSKVEKML
jgi:hypothetical protein